MGRGVNVVAGLLVLLVAGVAGCVGAPVVDYRPPAPGDARDVWLVRHGWHTRIAVRRSDVDAQLWPESRELGDVAYLEVGWGDRGFYPKDAPGVWDAINAVIRPTPAALHVGGFDRPPAEFLPEAPVVRLAVTPAGLDALARFFHRAYARDASGSPVRIRRGYYARSYFYEATGRYHAFNNSNTWVAEALRAAGFPLEPGRALTASSLLRQASQFGALIEPRRTSRRRRRAA